jgi:hypothetical protein
MRNVIILPNLRNRVMMYHLIFDGIIPHTKQSLKEQER